MRLAVVIPTLNEAAGIEAALQRLADLRARGARVIVADGGSRDDTVARAARLADRVVASPRGRALQMNAGARTPEAQDCDVLLFLHADTRLPAEADRLIFRGLSNSASRWGRFDVAIEGASPLLPVVATLMNWRSRLTGICTGDQAIFVERGTFLAMEGFAAIPLMEDIEFCRRARTISPPLALRGRVITSGRRWERDGVLRTILLMWQLRLAYFFGADPADLARRYRDAR
ncbi:MAG TPA: TIGR04283 family arsenosugar biosynthesis glycosyltransferase [Burkholderiaceae bacterium]|nr:TIGR04283 family arsenosugar biosynthesis glycosyltransferase [Burkholderiaceae bacterium]